MAQVATSLNIPDEQRPLDQIPISPVGGEHDKTESGASEEGQKDSQEQLTVFHSPENFTVKHPLMNKWTLWFTKPATGGKIICPPLIAYFATTGSGGGDNWADLLKKVVTFDSVEEFWGIYNNITKTSDLAIKSDYHLFKDGIRPEWEDPQNKKGGKWAHQFKNKMNVPIDELWLHVMLAAIGETLEKEGDSEVMGVVVNVRKGMYRIGVWTRTTGTMIKPQQGISGRSAEEGEETLLEIGRRFKEVLRLPAREVVEFAGHTESAHSGSSRARAMFTV